jgi:hypothetical protein
VFVGMALSVASVRAETIDQAMREQYRGSEAYCSVAPNGGRACVNLTSWCEDVRVHGSMTVEECVKAKRTYLTQQDHEEWEASRAAQPKARPEAASWWKFW